MKPKSLNGNEILKKDIKRKRFNNVQLKCCMREPIKLSTFNNHNNMR